MKELFFTSQLEVTAQGWMPSGFRKIPDDAIRRQTAKLYLACLAIAPLSNSGFPGEVTPYFGCLKNALDGFAENDLNVILGGRHPITQWVGEVQKAYESAQQERLEPLRKLQQDYLLTSSTRIH